MVIFSPALVVVELSTIVIFHLKQKLQNIAETRAATWRQKLAADFPSLLQYKVFIASAHYFKKAFFLNSPGSFAESLKMKKA